MKTTTGQDRHFKRRRWGREDQSVVKERSRDNGSGSSQGLGHQEGWAGRAAEAPTGRKREGGEGTAGPAPHPTSLLAARLP